jgi:hypothetical protein
VDNLQKAKNILAKFREKNKGTDKFMGVEIEQFDKEDLVSMVAWLHRDLNRSYNHKYLN